MVALLVVAASVALVLGEPVEAAAIAAVLVINTLIGFVTEWRARSAMAALINLEVPRAFVIRGGRLRAVEAQDLVPGDLIEVNAGQQVPADGRVLEEADLRTSEASLTGESLPVSKSAGVLPADTPLAERSNIQRPTVAAGTARLLGPFGPHRSGPHACSSGVRDEPTPLERDATRRPSAGWLALAVTRGWRGWDGSMRASRGDRAGSPGCGSSARSPAGRVPIALRSCATHCAAPRLVRPCRHRVACSNNRGVHGQDADLTSGE